MYGLVGVKYTGSGGGVYCSVAYVLKTDVFWVVMLCCFVNPDILKDRSAFVLSVELSE